MKTYLQTSAFLYLIVIAIVYLKKKKVLTIENTLYQGIILTAFVTIISDTLAAIYIEHFMEVSGIGEILMKLFLISLVTWMFLFSYYVYCISLTEKQLLVPISEHPERKKIRSMGIYLGLVILLSWIVIFALPIGITKIKNTFYYSGLALYVTYGFAALGMVSWIAMIIRNRKYIFNKKYFSLVSFFIITILTFTIQVFIPQISIVTAAVCFMTVLMFFTLENPDLQIIDELDKAKDEAELANQAKTDFLSSMSHEIRTPLNAIVGFSQALAKEDISGVAKEEVRDIIMASNGLLDIVNGILDISKIEANKIEIINNEYTTRKLIHEISTLVNARIGSKPLEFKVELDENLPQVLYGDAMRIKQIIINLLTNAVKYTSEG